MEVKKKERGRGWSPTIPFQGMPPMARRPPTRFHLLKIPLPPNSAKLGAKPLTHGLLGDIQDPNNSIHFLSPFTKKRYLPYILFSFFTSSLNIIPQKPLFVVVTSFLFFTI
jgi:hypothetical protein